MDVHLTLDGSGDLTAQIYRQLLDAVLDGRLRPDERVPPTREFAQSLGVSRGTVALAYDRLTAEGFLVGKVGAGTFVAGAASGATPARHAPAGDIRPRAVWDSIPPRTDPDPLPYDFRVGAPDPALFPLPSWRRLLARELQGSAASVTGYAESSGHPGLRAAIARHVGLSRSVRADARDVLVTTGAQQALDLIARVMVEPGDLVAVEEPGYPPARMLLRSLGARVVGVPVDDEGLVVEALPHAARLVYVTPSHQFPLGTPMSLARRSALLEWAEQRGAVVVEDDYDSEFRYSGRPLEPLQGLDRCGRVVYVGSFSKTLLPTLRLGFLIAPASLQPALRAARQLTDWHGDPAPQGALARFIDEGMLGRHIRRATKEYSARRDVLLAELAGLAEVTPVVAAAGLHVCVRLDAAIDAGKVVGRARDAGVGVEDLSRYCADGPPQNGLVLGFGGIRPAAVPDGVRLLAAGLRAP